MAVSEFCDRAVYFQHTQHQHYAVSLNIMLQIVGHSFLNEEKVVCGIAS